MFENNVYLWIGVFGFILGFITLYIYFTHMEETEYSTLNTLVYSGISGVVCSLVGIGGYMLYKNRRQDKLNEPFMKS